MGSPPAVGSLPGVPAPLYLLSDELIDQVRRPQAPSLPSPLASAFSASPSCTPTRALTDRSARARAAPALSPTLRRDVQGPAEQARGGPVSCRGTAAALATGGARVAHRCQPGPLPLCHPTDRAQGESDGDDGRQALRRRRVESRRVRWRLRQLRSAGGNLARYLGAVAGKRAHCHCSLRGRGWNSHWRRGSRRR